MKVIRAAGAAGRAPALGTAGAGYPDPGYVRRLAGASRFSWAARARHNEPVTWDAYLEGFHAARPGITEAILRRSVRGGREGAGDPYCWLAGAVPAHGRVLDLGCGSGPLCRVLTGRQYIGLDLSGAELGAARQAGAGPLLRASAAAIPLPDRAADIVACSMTLMVTTPLPRVLAEITRVLRPGGLVVATVPAAGPLRASDRIITAGLVAALGRVPGYPAGDEPPGCRPA